MSSCTEWSRFHTHLVNSQGTGLNPRDHSHCYPGKRSALSAEREFLLLCRQHEVQAQSRIARTKQFCFFSDKSVYQNKEGQHMTHMQVSFSRIDLQFCYFHHWWWICLSNTGGESAFQEAAHWQPPLLWTSKTLWWSKVKMTYFMI